jgi:formylmethanofuran dehydrogenase subunit E
VEKHILSFSLRGVYSASRNVSRICCGNTYFPDPGKVEDWQDLKAWHVKRKTKEEQDINCLISQIKEVGEEILTQQTIQIKPEFIRKTGRGPMAICPGCGETYPTAMGSFCIACQGDGPYEWLEDNSLNSIFL